MADEDVWIASWWPITGSALGGSYTASRPMQQKFKDQKSAVSFVMGLDAGLRATAQIIMPGGEPVELPIIEQMHAAQAPAGQ
jgi:hypothetical protein